MSPALIISLYKKKNCKHATTNNAITISTIFHKMYNKICKTSLYKITVFVFKVYPHKVVGSRQCSSDQYNSIKIYSIPSNFQVCRSKSFEFPPRNKYPGVIGAVLLLFIIPVQNEYLESIFLRDSSFFFWHAKTTKIFDFFLWWGVHPGAPRSYYSERAINYKFTHARHKTPLNPGQTIHYYNRKYSGREATGAWWEEVHGHSSQHFIIFLLHFCTASKIK